MSVPMAPHLRTLISCGHLVPPGGRIAPQNVSGLEGQAALPGMPGSWSLPPSLPSHSNTQWPKSACTTSSKKRLLFLGQAHLIAAVPTRLGMGPSLVSSIPLQTSFLTIWTNPRDQSKFPLPTKGAVVHPDGLVSVSTRQEGENRAAPPLVGTALPRVSL